MGGPNLLEGARGKDQRSLCYCSNPLVRGEEELYTQMGLFVQTILTDRYIQRRELRLVSLESSSSVKYGMRKIFLFSSFAGSYRVV